MKTKEGNIRDDIILLKEILDLMVMSLPHSTKIDLLAEYEEDMANRNHITRKSSKKITDTEDKKERKKYDEQKIKQTEVIRLKVLLKLLDCKYGKALTNATLAEVGYILNMTRESVRQIENRALIKFKNPNLLKELDKIRGIAEIYEHRDLAIEFKKKKEKLKAV